MLHGHAKQARHVLQALRQCHTCREKKRAMDLKVAYDDVKKRLDTTLKDQRMVVRKVRGATAFAEERE